MPCGVALNLYMPLQTIFAILATAIALANKVPYITDIYRLKTTPHSYSWLIWTLLQVTGALIMLSGGAGFGVASLLAGTVLCGFIFLLSLRYGTKNITTFDTICFVGALCATGVWFILHDAVLSILFVSAIDLLAFLPTFRKAYVEPYSETVSTYFLSAVAEVFALFALGSVTFTTSFYLISLVVTNSACSGIIWFRRTHLGVDKTVQ